MSRLTREFFAYVWAWYRLANRHRRGMPGEKFSRAILKLASAKYESAWPMKANRGHGEWAGSAWFRAAGLNKLVQREEEHDRTAVSDPAKYLFAADKNLVRTTSAFLTHRDFVALEREQVSLYELLEREHIGDRVEEQFGVDPRTLDYRGPVVVGWQRYPKGKEKDTHSDKKSKGQETTQTRRPTEKICWLGILPRHIVDLTKFGTKLRGDPAGRAMLLRHGFDLLIDLTEEAPSHPSPAIRVDPRIAARALTLLAGGRLEQASDYDLARDLDLGDGPHMYVFLYEKKLQPLPMRVLTTMTPNDRLAWYHDTPTNDATSAIMTAAKHYTAPPLILVYSADMAAAIMRQLPWTWHQSANELRTIRATTKESGQAQMAMVILASALAALCANHVPVTLLRQAWGTRDGTLPFDATAEQLAKEGLLDTSGKSVVPARGAPIAFNSFFQDDSLLDVLERWLWWLWSKADIAESERARYLDLAIRAIKRVMPEWSEQLYQWWVHDFPRQPEVLLNRLWRAMEERRWDEVGEVIDKLVRLGERDKVDSYWEHIFPRLQHQPVIDDLVAAAKVTVRTATGVSYSVSALLPHFQQAEVAVLLRAAAEQQGAASLLAHVTKEDASLSQFILTTVRDLPMDRQAKARFNAVAREMPSFEGVSSQQTSKRSRRSPR